MILKTGNRGIIITPDYIITSKKYKDGFWIDYTHKKPFIPKSLKKLHYNAGFKKIRVITFPEKDSEI